MNSVIVEGKDFILASGSKQRQELLAQIGISPKLIVPADIDESEKRGENATAYVKRMALEKAQKVALLYSGENILSGDTVVVVGATILHKAHNQAEQTAIMNKLSGKAHRVITAICLINKTGKVSVRAVSTRVLMKKLSPTEIKDYVASNTWVGACGYRVEDMEAYVKKIVGSYSGIVGLPLYETKNLLNGIGIK